MEPFELRPGTAPLLVSFPHVGTDIPDEIALRMTPAATSRVDTDWHLPRLYDFVASLGCSTLVARASRYVIDLNRPPEDGNLYPGQDTTGLCPLDTFRRDPLYLPGRAPDEVEVSVRRDRYWYPYHAALAAEIGRIRAVHGVAVLWDAHSIASVLPRFFDGKLPDLNLGTADGASCDAALQSVVEAQMAAQVGFTWIANGRFKGGYITRNYGRPRDGIHALQLEMCQCTYMDEAAPFAYRADLASRVQPVVRAMLAAALAWAAAR